MSSRNIILVVVVIVVGLAIWGYNNKQTRSVGDDTRDAMHDLGRDVEHGAKKLERNTRDAVDDLRR
jgi:hypothetical protein